MRCRERDDPRPEVRVLADASRRLLRDLLQGKRVTLTDEGRLRDRCGRILAYIHPDDGTFVNAKITDADMRLQPPWA